MDQATLERRQNEAADMMKSLYPIGKKRWIRVVFRDFEWCKKHLHWFHKDSEEKNELGMDVIAIGIRDDVNPQVAALQELRGELISFMYNSESDALCCCSFPGWLA